MKSQNLTLGLLTTAAAMMAKSRYHTGELILQPRADTNDSILLDKYSSRAHSRKGRAALNQRQRRLDRRRAHAAGCKKAFR